ncbi:PIF1-like helicase [Medicago truncatula]|uniref:PIF1-like helicase n=1 Tax=Medicago truncatula TaxID=3880 RepID=G7J6F0_MEDTR|nr:PIF1-like helicase [Medicago truncatula]
MPTFTNKLIVDELNYNKDELAKTRADMLLMLTDEQRCVHDKIKESIQGVIDFVYPDLNDNFGDPLFFQERRILAPTLDSVDFDYVCRSGGNSDVQSEWFTTEFLNGIKSYGIQNHRLKLRVGCPVMLMRNIDQANGLCNGTRAGMRVFIPTMNLILSDPGLPFKFRRKQFPSTVCFPVFTHGQLYVIVSRVTSRKGLKLLILDEDNNVYKETTNVVYREVFQKV